MISREAGYAESDEPASLGMEGMRGSVHLETRCSSDNGSLFLNHEGHERSRRRGMFSWILIEFSLGRVINRLPYHLPMEKQMTGS